MKKKVIIFIVMITILYIYSAMLQPVKQHIYIEVGTKMQSQDFLVNQNTQAVIKTKLTEQQLSSLQDYDVAIEVGGREYISTVSVIDTKPPLVHIQNLKVKQHHPIEPEMFIKSIVDETEVNVFFQSHYTTDTLGKKKVTIVVKDQANNETMISAILEVLP